MRSSSRAALLFAATLGVVSYHCRPAFAYCRATACDPTMTNCGMSAHGCQTKGKPIQWKDGSVDLLVDKAGSMLRGISGADTQQAVESALSTWMSADCPGGGHPSFTGNTELKSGLKADYSDSGPNENVVVYEDGTWSYEPGAVAKTLLVFDLDSGDMQDADVVFNSAEFPLAIDPTSKTDIDVSAVLMHEIGHVLGLAHSDAPGATMQPETQGFATAALKTLEPDDMAGICAVYPPMKAGTTKQPSSSSNASSGTPSGDSASSGCSVASARALRSVDWFGVLGLVSAFVLGRARRRKA
jgi:hypothetical protein